MAPMFQKNGVDDGKAQVACIIGIYAILGDLFIF